MITTSREDEALKKTLKLSLFPGHNQGDQFQVIRRVIRRLDLLPVIYPRPLTQKLRLWTPQCVLCFIWRILQA